MRMSASSSDGSHRTAILSRRNRRSDIMETIREKSLVENGPRAASRASRDETGAAESRTRPRDLIFIGKRPRCMLPMVCIPARHGGARGTIRRCNTTSSKRHARPTKKRSSNVFNATKNCHQSPRRSFERDRRDYACASRAIKGR